MLESINPIKILREQRNLTQAQLADLTGLGRNYIIRNEQGCYPSISPEILNALERRRPLPTSHAALNLDYDEWRTNQRKHSYGLLPVGYFDKVNMHPHRHPFIAWRTAGNLSQIAISRHYCIHPSTVQRFEGQPEGCLGVPASLKYALRISGYDELDLRGLDVAFGAFLAQLPKPVLIRS